MGCFAGIVALVAAGGVLWLAQFLGASTGVAVASAIATLVVGALPVVLWGHRGFGGGGNTDFTLYLALVGVAVAVVLPRFQSRVACEEAEAHLAWLASAQADFRAETGSYTSEVEALGSLAGREGFEFDPDITIEISAGTDSTYRATAAHPKCRVDREPYTPTVDQTGTIR